VEVEGKTKIAIVGEVNTGKSSFIKHLTNNSNIMIGPLPGETVKSASYTYKDFVIIDTPGLNDVDKENSKKVNKELKTYDNVILFLNAAGTVLSKNELDLYNKLIKSKTNVLIVINKIDKATSIDSVIRFVRQNTGDKAQVIAISTKTGENIDQLEEAMLNFIS